MERRGPNIGDWLAAYTSTRLIGCELLMIGCLYDTLGLFMQKYPQPGSRDMQILDVSTGPGSTDASNYLDNDIDSACILIDIVNVFQTIILILVFQTILRNNKIY